LKIGQIVVFTQNWEGKNAKTRNSWHANRAQNFTRACDRFEIEPTTPTTERALQRHADALEIATPSRKDILDKQFKKGALVVAKCSTQLRATLAENTAAEKERKAQKSRPKRQLQDRGTIYAYKAREMTRQRDEEGGTQLDRALTREWRLEMELKEMQELREKERRAYEEGLREFQRNNS
jgi:hypothetical protein